MFGELSIHKLPDNGLPRKEEKRKKKIYGRDDAARVL